jgi:predicted 2-oxoglutarate/Fe(II)-dependent dioxygenase YbiX
MANRVLLTVPNFLSEAECAEQIAKAERVGFDEAPVTTSHGMVRMPEVRNNTRVMLDDVALAASLWERLRPHVPAQFDERAALGLNERFRFYRYDPGQFFAIHRDGHFRRENGERSELTFMVYLNEGYQGGETRFIESKRDVVPRTGMALLFTHAMLHDSAPLISGRKYVLRSDVMFAAV